jgi:hypothetical protein
MPSQIKSPAEKKNPHSCPVAGRRKEERGEKGPFCPETFETENLEKEDRR